MRTSIERTALGKAGRRGSAGSSKNDGAGHGHGMGMGVDVRRSNPAGGQGQV